MKYLISLLLLVLSANVSSMTYHDIKLDNADHAYPCNESYNNQDGQHKDTGYCVIKRNYICYHSLKDPATFNNLAKTFLIYDTRIKDYRLNSLHKIFAFNVVNGRYPHRYRYFINGTKATIPVTNTCGLYSVNPNNFNQ